MFICMSNNPNSLENSFCGDKEASFFVFCAFFSLKDFHYEQNYSFCSFFNAKIMDSSSKLPQFVSSCILYSASPLWQSRQQQMTKGQRSPAPFSLCILTSDFPSRSCFSLPSQVESPLTCTQTCMKPPNVTVEPLKFISDVTSLPGDFIQSASSEGKSHSEHLPTESLKADHISEVSSSLSKTLPKCV